MSKKCIFFKTDFSYLGLEHDVDLKSDEELNKIRVWGLPFIRPTDPVPLAIWGGLASGALINVLRRRPIFSSSLISYTMRS